LRGRRIFQFANGFLSIASHALLCVICLLCRHRVYRCIWIEIIANKQRTADMRVINLCVWRQISNIPSSTIRYTTMPYATGDTSNYSCVYIHSPIPLLPRVNTMPAECNS